MPHATPLTVDAIRAFLASREEMAARGRGRKGKMPLSIPGEAPDVARGETLLHRMAGQVDALLGPGMGGHMATELRLREVLDVLSRGTLADERARVARIPADAAARGVPAEYVAAAREGAATRARHLALTTDEEVAAVLACLDALEPAFPGLVPLVRLHHAEGERPRREAEAAARREAASQAPDAPRLTPERIARLLALVPQLAGMADGVEYYFRSPGAYEYLGKTAEKVFGKRVAKKLAGLGEEPDTFLADLTWMRITAAQLGDGRRMVGTLAEMEARANPDAWRDPHRPPAEDARQAAGAAALMNQLLDTQRKVSLTAEEAVREALPEIRRVLREAKGDLSLPAGKRAKAAHAAMMAQIEAARAARAAGRQRGGESSGGKPRET